MEFSPPPRRPPNVTLLPMINVVFLLLIFFLLAAKIAPPEPFATDPPEARAAEDVRRLLSRCRLDGVWIFASWQERRRISEMKAVLTPLLPPPRHNPAGSNSTASSPRGLRPHTWPTAIATGRKRNMSSRPRKCCWTAPS